MKKNIFNILIAVSAFFSLAACNNVVFNEESYDIGYLSLSLGMDEDVATKALVSPSQDMAFKIEIYKGDKLVTEVQDHRIVNQDEPISLTIGKYKVKAIYGDNVAGFDKPYYLGETDVTIVTDEVVDAEIVCSLANVKVTVDFDKSIKNNFSSYSVKVGDGSGSELEFSSNMNNIDATGYIPATGDLNWILTLTDSEGKIYNTKGTYDNVKARQHYDLQFALSETSGDTGYAAIRLVVDDTLIEQEYEVELDFSESVLPSYTTNDGFVLTNQMSVMVGDDSKKELTFTAAEGIESFIIVVDEIPQTKSNSRLEFELVEAEQTRLTELLSLGIKAQSIPYGATSAVVDFTDYIKSLPVGNYNLDISVYDTKNHVSECPMDISVLTDVDADILTIDPWAKFAIVTGRYFTPTPPEGLTFMYKKNGASSWTTIDASNITYNSSAKTYDAEIGGLDADSKYIVKAVSAEDTETREVEFTTQSAGTLYNMNFDDWYQSGKVWYPYTSGANPSIWDCANEATASFPFSVSKSYTTPEDTHSMSGRSARLESANVVIKFAAGNLYTGKFGEVLGTEGASLKWGVPFNSRPVALKGYYDYNSGIIDKVDDKYSSMKGQPDKCQILVILTDWTEPFEINTVEGKFVDLSTNNKSIIALAKMESSVTTDGFEEFTLPLEYRDLTRTPTYIVIACCSSYLGDYFTGSTSSLMYVDEFSFEYDVTTLTEAEKEKVNYR